MKRFLHLYVVPVVIGMVISGLAQAQGADKELEEARALHKELKELKKSSEKYVNEINDLKEIRLSDVASLEIDRNNLNQEINVLEKRISELSYSMLEPLSFQDLVGQRIQRIIHLVKSMETHIEDLVISCGIKIQKHKPENIKEKQHKATIGSSRSSSSSSTISDRSKKSDHNQQ